MNKPIKKYNIVLIGAGNLAFNLARGLKETGHNIRQIISRSTGSASELALQCGCQYDTNLKNLFLLADIYIIAVKDDQIHSVINNMPGVSGIVIHTSGTVSSAILSEKFNHYGVFYPLQSFNKNRPAKFGSVPVLLHASDQNSFNILNELASGISGHIYIADDNKRKKIHLAAVFACNFTNYLYSIAEKILKEEELDLSVLSPLINETAQRISNISPSLSQTGPAARKDMNVINEHLDMLQNQEDFRRIYQLLTENILSSNTEKTNHER